jgi:hypothetical protein
MDFTLSTFISALKLIPPALAAAPQVEEVFMAAKSLLHPDNQDAAKAAYEALKKDNDEGYVELDKLAAEAEALP